ncbi:MAG: hypothetical protein A3J93_01540 [Candidatus Magasanikbacteria bacterium RIFOXYC2_FULL_42_28]|uniref:SHSP domain-containing protein n=1 Tax=Candidatus Magasanikbacteria bacterium RIFOXYC2_FULL_42_28 TaxID=1798704 RepID=A0A1F6NXW9_9BACT|nr:MAG: hypothetical protein A3J93_01540 [Candidatus Magasanikbacteria bacterium RIFOXYC2_FULL_42_28]
MFTNNQSVFLSDNVPMEEGIELAAQLAPSGARHESEGQLSIDVAQTAEELIIVATMAGATPDKVELHLHNDVLTIRGERATPIPNGAEHFYEECYWGKFSRTIVLPTDVAPEFAKAEYRNGVLTVRLPKKQADNKIPIFVVEE